MDRYYEDERSHLYLGDVLDCLRAIPDESVQCAITSPPYFGLRDYDTAEWSGGDPECKHKPKRQARSQRPLGKLHGGTDTVDASEPTYRATCGQCGATRVDSQIGLEDTPTAYVERLVAVFREVRRVLRKDGTFWLNIGDSYSSGARTTQTLPTIRSKEYDAASGKQEYLNGLAVRPPTVEGIKPKDLIGIPWMLAFALREDGWYLRQDIVWSKQNPMPESVTDRCTKAHEYVFLLSKSERYFYDHRAIEESARIELWPQVGNGHFDAVRSVIGGGARGAETDGNKTRNKRSVWSIASDPFPGSHFAAFPPALVQPMILAGTSAFGACLCGAPFERKTERQDKRHWTERREKGDKWALANKPGGRNDGGVGFLGDDSVTTGWEPTCKCYEPDGQYWGGMDDPEFKQPCVVLDPFVGTGTTAIEAKRLGRYAIGIDLSQKYLDMTIRGLQLERRPTAPEVKVIVSPEWEAAFGGAPVDAVRINPRPKLDD